MTLVNPICRYGHGDLKQAKGLDGKPGNFLAPLIDNGFVNSTFGYTFQVW